MSVSKTYYWNRKLGNKFMAIAAFCIGVGFVPLSSNLEAQSSAAEMLEEARARAREMEELKAVLNGPDQNMRLASFDIMVTSGDDAMRQIAIDSGLASADALMQAMAFKEAILGMNRIVLTLAVDTTQPEAMQSKAQKYLDDKGNIYELPIIETDRQTGIFVTRTGSTGQVYGVTVSFKYAHDTGTLALFDEAIIKGPVTLGPNARHGSFIATATIR